MPDLKPKAQKLNPYANQRFVVSWDGHAVAGVSKVGGLGQFTQVVNFREGGAASAARKSPGQTSFAPVTLERGVSFDLAFQQWASKIWYTPNSQSAAPGDASEANTSLKDFRKDIDIALFNEAGQKVLGYQLYRCWVSEFTATPELGANGNGIAIQRIVLQNDGWEQVGGNVPTAEPSFTVPTN
jgi:phage tail-like protein